jgi:ubiquinone/menaquinone biosynthesis C-methylase UbiE
LCREISEKQNLVIGMDISRNAIKYCNSRKQKNEFYIVASAFHLPFKKNVFDNIVCSEVIEHISDPKKLLNEIYFSLKNKGKQIITTPNYGFSLWRGYELLWDLFGKGRNYRFQHISKFNIKKLRSLIPNIKSIYSVFIASPLFSFFNEKLAKKIMNFELKTMKNNGCLIIAESEK